MRSHSHVPTIVGTSGTFSCILILAWPPITGVVDLCSRTIRYGKYAPATKGTIWYNESCTKPNTIARFDPQTQKFPSWVIPSSCYIIRNMHVTPDGNRVIATSTSNGAWMVKAKYRLPQES